MGLESLSGVIKESPDFHTKYSLIPVPATVFHSSLTHIGAQPTKAPVRGLSTVVVCPGPQTIRGTPRKQPTSARGLCAHKPWFTSNNLICGLSRIWARPATYQETGSRVITQANRASNYFASFMRMCQGSQNYQYTRSLVNCTGRSWTWFVRLLAAPRVFWI